MSEKFSLQWKRSIQPRRQRKYRHNAPLHLRQKFVSAHLSKDLRKKYQTRTLHVRKGDTIIVVRGEQRKKSGKVDHISLKSGNVYVTGIEIMKKDGTKNPIALEPSNLMITELNVDDKKRQKVLQRKLKTTVSQGNTTHSKKEKTKKSTE